VTKIEMDFEFKWSEAQKVLAKELGEGRCLEFTDAKSKQSCRLDQPKAWEKLRMQVDEWVYLRTYVCVCACVVYIYTYTCICTTFV